MNNNTAIEQNRYLRSDEDFNALYIEEMQLLAPRHWTPIHIAELAAGFLGDEGSKILDIGSGVGKFCLAAACYAPQARFFGVEQRDYLVEHALKAKQTLGLTNVTFINANFTQFTLQEFNHFYFFNSFQENIDLEDKIDDSFGYSWSLYEYYNRYLHVGWHRMPPGTRIVTYHYFRAMPDGYHLVESHMDGDLNFWIKE